MHNVLCHFSFLLFISKEILVIHHAPALKQQSWKDLNISAAGSHLCKPAYMGEKTSNTIYSVYYTYQLVTDHFTQTLINVMSSLNFKTTTISAVRKSQFLYVLMYQENNV